MRTTATQGAALSAWPVFLLTTALLAGCSKPAQEAPLVGSDASAFVQQANAAVAKAADLLDAPSFADAKRGFIAAPKEQIKDATGTVIWDFDAFSFIQGAAPPTVNPSLWRLAMLNNHVDVGLFKVIDGIWQVRGFDLANLTPGSKAARSIRASSSACFT